MSRPRDVIPDPERQDEDAPEFSVDDMRRARRGAEALAGALGPDAAAQLTKKQSGRQPWANEVPRAADQ